MTRALSLRDAPRLLLQGLLCLAWWLLSVSAVAQVRPAAQPASAAAPLPSLTQFAASASAPASTGAARVVVLNREVIALRGSLFGNAPQVRAAEAEERIRRALGRGGELKVETIDVAEGVLVNIDGALMFAVVADDSPERTLTGARSSAADAAAALRQVIAESRESRDVRALLIAAVIAAVAGVVLLLLIRLLAGLRGRIGGWLARQTELHAERLRVAGIDVVQREGLIRLQLGLLKLVFWLLALLLVYEWASLSLALFPFTRPWGEQLSGFLLGLVGRFALAIVHAIPDLLAAVLIFWLAWLLTRVLRGFFGKVAASQVRLSWLGADVAPTTSKLCVTAVWLFALVMAYPYLPGSDTEAFKGLSVLIGLMVSLGASNLVGQLASGLILIYTRTLRAGEYVRIGSDEGTVVRLGAFATRIRTGMGEELTIANSQVLSVVTRNYSRSGPGKGFIVDTTVTIGYDAPWRQVHAMLIEAARRTPGVLSDPVPQVFQVALSDFYPEYRLVCLAVPDRPQPRAEVISQLHASVQDVFNEHGVQIMSPHYLGDPAEAKLVPPARWYAAPAKATGGEPPA